MANTFTQLLYHIVFSTKQRRPFITEEIETRLYPYLGGIVRDEKGVLLVVGGMPDHPHLLIRYHANGKLCDLVRQIKSSSSGWIHDHFSMLKDFAWQEGYGGFTVSPSSCPEVKAYIQHQRNTIESAISGRSSWRCCDFTRLNSMNDTCLIRFRRP